MISLRAHRRLGYQPTERVQYFRKDLREGGDSTPIVVDRYEGPRDDLHHLCKRAEDSPTSLESYRDLGRILVARAGDLVVGHLQLTPTRRAGEIEIKNMAVLESHEGRGIGRLLVETAVQQCRVEACSSVVVATATADIDNLRFYQRLGFRMSVIERDAFTSSAGYPDAAALDGINLRDRVWFALDPEPIPLRRRVGSTGGLSVSSGHI